MPFDIGADPKSVVCAFFKQGQCTKGDKCKFSHDLTLERKCEKRSVYIDARDEELEKGIFLKKHFSKDTCLCLLTVGFLLLKYLVT